MHQLKANVLPVEPTPERTRGGSVGQRPVLLADGDPVKFCPQTGFTTEIADWLLGEQEYTP